MNKAGKIAYLWLKAQSDSEKFDLLHKRWECRISGVYKNISLKSSMPTIYL